MKHIMSRKSWNSVRYKLLFGVILLTVPLIALLIYNSVYSIGVVREQVADSTSSMVSFYMGLIDENLDEADKYLNTMVALDMDLQALDGGYSEKDYTLAKARMSNKISGDIFNYKSVESFFIYTGEKQEFVEASKGSETYEGRERVREVLQSMILSGEASQLQQRWIVRKIDKDYYLFRMLQTGGTYAGAWTKVSSLIPLYFTKHKDKDKDTFLFATSEGIPMLNSELVQDNGIELNRGFEHYYLSGTPNRYLVVGAKSDISDLAIIALVPDNHILENLPAIRRTVIVVSFGSIIMLPFGLIFIRRIVLSPLQRIIAAMKRTGEGNLQYRIGPYRTSEEFQLLNDSFNRMLAQIQELTVNVYEEQLSKQKAELQHLQLQINPHFFMNSLNIMYSFAETGNYQGIQELTLCLVKYFRYMFRSNLTYVPLKDELEHTRNYLRIQELRMPNSLVCSMQAPDYLLNCPVPPLIVKTFVENAVKHAVTLDHIIHLYIEIDICATETIPCLTMKIWDTGKGFPNEVLTEIRSGNRIVDEEGEHIGIWNVQRRLRLLYREHASISFANREPSGATIEIVLPLHPEN